VPFAHKRHYDAHDVACATCHHAVKAQGNVEPATRRCTTAGCHTADSCNDKVVSKGNEPCPLFEDAFHADCIGCHRQKDGPVRCRECHTR
jgi:hypothetical protein